MKIFVTRLVLLVLPIVGHAVPASSTRLNEANQAYASGQYEKALGLYQQILASGQTSADLYYNMGQTCWKLGQKGRVLYYFKKALVLSPRWRQCADNVKQLYRELNIPIETSRCVEWIQKIPLNSWTILLGLSLWLAAFFALKIVFSALMRLSFIVGVILSIAAALVLGIVVWIDRQELKTAVVLCETPLRFAPTAQSPQRGVIREGLSCRIVETKGDFSFVEVTQDNAKLDGWIEDKNIGRIHQH
jgi:tetratricopeptide (TPR) repeat protein